jgi:hypothetical protein
VTGAAASLAGPEFGPARQYPAQSILQNDWFRISEAAIIVFDSMLKDWADKLQDTGRRLSGAINAQNGLRKTRAYRPKALPLNAPRCRETGQPPLQLPIPVDGVGMGVNALCAVSTRV